MQLTASGDFEGIGGVGLFEQEADVDFQLLFQTVSDVAAGHVLAFPAGKGGAVDHEVHAQRRFFDPDGRHLYGMVGIADGVADSDVFDAGHDADVPAGNLSCFYPLQALVAEALVDLGHSAPALVVDNDDSLGGMDRAPVDAADAQTSDVVVVGEGRNLKAQGFFRIVGVALHLLDDGVEKGTQAQPVLAGRPLVDLFAGGFNADTCYFGRIAHDNSLAGDAVQNLKIQLLVRGFKVHEELINFVDDFCDPGILFVDFVNQQDGKQTLFQGFLQDKTGLGHGAFGRIDQEDDRVDGFDDPLHF